VSAIQGLVTSLIRGPGGARETSTRRTIRLINFSWLTVIASLGLTLLGVHAIDVSESLDPGGMGGMPLEAWKQVVFMIVGMLGATMIALPHYRLLSLLAWPAMIAVTVLLVLLLVPVWPESVVPTSSGARSWFDFGPASFQPSEFAKIAYVLAAAHYLRYRSSHRTIRGLIAPGLMAAIPIGLITLQPDLGTASLFVPALFAMLIAAGARPRHLTLIVVLAALAAPAAYPFLKPHQKTRLVAMLKAIEGDDDTAHDINFQSFTAQTLIGAGGVDGAPSPAARALVHYNRLPESHNDMVYAVIVTRFGFWGGLGVISLYLLWFVGALGVAASCRDPLGRLVAVGIPAFIAAQMLINIGMNLGIVPIIGITLPFVSYGGSSLLASWLMVGLVANVALHKPRPPFRESFEYPEEDARTQHAAAIFGRAVAFDARSLGR